MLSLNKLHLRHGRAAALMGSGKLGLNAPRFFNFEGSLQHFDVSAFLQAPRTSLNATLKIAGELESPSGRGPEAKVEFRMGNSRIADHAVTGEGRIEFLGRDLATARGSAEVELRLGQNQLLARGGIGQKGDQLRLSLDAPKLAQIGFGLRGSLEAEAVVETGVADFGQSGQKLPDIRFSAEGKSLSFPGDHKLAVFSANGSLQGDQVALTVSLKDYGSWSKNGGTKSRAGDERGQPGARVGMHSAAGRGPEPRPANQRRDSGNRCRNGRGGGTPDGQASSRSCRGTVSSHFV